MERLIQAVKDHALAHYGKGWDVIVECYDDEDIQRDLEGEGITTEAEALAFYQEIMEVREDRENDCRWGEDGDLVERLERLSWVTG